MATSFAPSPSRRVASVVIEREDTSSDEDDSAVDEGNGLVGLSGNTNIFGAPGGQRHERRRGRRVRPAPAAFSGSSGSAAARPVEAPGDLGWSVVWAHQEGDDGTIEAPADEVPKDAVGVRGPPPVRSVHALFAQLAATQRTASEFGQCYDFFEGK